MHGWGGSNRVEKRTRAAGTDIRGAVRAPRAATGGAGRSTLDAAGGLAGERSEMIGSWRVARSSS